MALTVGQASDKERSAALDHLLHKYHPALMAYARSQIGISQESAEDLVQGFILEKVLQQNLLAHADRKKGRFRNFLLQVFSNYVRSQMRYEHAQKRNVSESRKHNVADDPNIVSCASGITREYNLAWARQIIAEAVERMRSECRTKNRGDLWEIFQNRVLRPILEEEDPLSYKALVGKYQFGSPTQAFNALLTAKRMFKRCIEAAVRDTVESDELVEREIRDLRSIFASDAEVAMGPNNAGERRSEVP